MKRSLYLVFFLSTFCCGIAQVQDSLFIYQSGEISYRECFDQIDSIAFVAPNYYELVRSAQVYNELKSNPDLTLFAQMIKQAGYEKKLDRLAIWAPINSALTNVDLSDSALVKRIVENHISRLENYPAAGSDGKFVTMFSNKRMLFQSNENGYTLKGVEVVAPCIYTAQSKIFILKNRLPLILNVWEYISQEAGHDLLKAYINTHNKTTYNSATNSYITTNDILDKFPFANNEDSLCTAIIPTDAAWTEAYNKLYPYCAAPTSGSINTQDESTKLAIIKNNFFRGRLSLPTSDSVFISTTRSQLKKPSVMLEGAQTEELSNGNCFNVDELKMFNPENWDKTIKIEAEDGSYGRKITNATVTTKEYPENTFNISDKKYLTIDPTSITSTPSVEFRIPNTLSTKYNVYCVFVPTSISDATDLRPSKVRFYVSYLSNKNPGGIQSRGAVTATNTLNLSAGVLGATFTTDPTNVQKILVLKDFQLPFCNLYFGNNAAINVSLTVENATKATEVATYDRTFRIDYIILEPVQ
jgi:hypothetical protein